MRVTSAQLQDPAGDDRILVTGDHVIMLDGASAFRPVPVPVSSYVDQLGTKLLEALENDRADLQTALANGIAKTAAELRLSPGQSPSSTVTIVRERQGHISILVLGDNLVVFPAMHVTDDRLNSIAPDIRAAYQARLAAGAPYGPEHQHLLAELQQQQALQRNAYCGYWIAEADPTAARHAVTVQLSTAATPWAFLATDGAYKTMTHLSSNDWPTIARNTSSELAEILDHCHDWEAHHDPDGRVLPCTDCLISRSDDGRSRAGSTFWRRLSQCRRTGIRGGR